MGKSCLLNHCFAWCLEHHSISTEEDGEELCTTRTTTRDGSGRVQTIEECDIKRKCRDRTENSDNHDACDIVECGKRFFGVFLRSKHALTG